MTNSQSHCTHLKPYNRGSPVVPFPNSLTFPKMTPKDNNKIIFSIEFADGRVSMLR